MKRIMTFAVQLIMAAILYAASPLETFLGNRSINAENTSVLIRDLVTGKMLVSHNIDVPLLPASIMKTVTIASLLSEKGPEEKYHTLVYADGVVESGTLNGDLVVKGSGDPTLGANCEPKSFDIADEIVASLKQNKISHIAGNLRVDTSLYVGPACPDSWLKEDKVESYGTGCHALNFQHNATGGRSVHNPATVFLRSLHSRLTDAGITVGGTDLANDEKLTDSAATLLVDHASDCYSEVMRSCMMRSDNLFAESMLRTFGLARGKDGSTAAGASEMLEYWKRKGIPARGVRIVDGSGLSRSNRVTARFIAGVLDEMNEDEEYPSFLPLAGREGTLSSFLKETDLDSFVAMKTGSMRGIQCYAGYKLDELFAPTHVIVIIMNEIGKRAQAREAAENLLLDVFHKD